MKTTDVIPFEKLLAQTEGLQEEFTALAKKKPDAPVSVFKLKFVNSTLSALNETLGKRYRPFDDFESFDPDDLPTASDVTMILGQYLECAETMRSFSVQKIYGDWYWRFEDDPNNQYHIPTSPPKKIKNR